MCIYAGNEDTKMAACICAAMPTQTQQGSTLHR